MIECPTCRISFSPRCRRCPRCEVYEARLEDRLEYLVQAAEIDLDQGKSPAEVETKLIAEGISTLEAREIVFGKIKKVARRERSYGFLRLVVGAGLMFAAALVLVIGVVLPSLRLVVLGLIVAASAAWPLALGVYGVVTGRGKR